MNTLYENSGGTMEKTKLIKLVELVYSMNPESKGKSRKRTIQEVIDIINSNS